MKKFLTCCILLLMCTAQPTEASKWRYIYPYIARSLRHINNQPNGSYSSYSTAGSDNPWNYIMPCILLAGGVYLLWPVFKKKDNKSSSAHLPRYQQPYKRHEIILANGGGVLLR